MRLGLDDVILGDVSRFAIDGANGESTRGIECFYEQNGALLGFKAKYPPRRSRASSTAGN